MKKSEPILPLPIYDDLFDQQRFSSLCDPDCQQQLIFPTNALPSFQFVRDSSLEVPTMLILRNACRDKTANFYKVIPEGWGMYDQKFIDTFGELPQVGAIYDNGIDPPEGRIATMGQTDCGVLKEKALPQYYSIADPDLPSTLVLTNAIGSAKIHFKISVDLFYRQTAFTIKIYDGTDNTGVLIGTISAAGVYNYDFTSVNGAIALVFDDYLDGDKYSISHMQASFWNPAEMQLFVDDTIVDYSGITVKQTALNKDIVTYCDITSQYPLLPGDYYYILVMGSEIYFSEIFNLKTPAQLEKYYRLFWYNTCDINDTVGYGFGTTGCILFNTIYLDATLFSPEFATVDDGVENGLGDRNTTFKRWQKSIKLEIPKSPNFLTDALSAIFIHNTILLRNPINENKENANLDYSVLSVTNEIQDVLLNCYQNVKLKLVLTERYTNKNCCDPIVLFDCGDAQTPTLTSQSEPFPGVFLLEGVVMSGTFAVVEYKLNGGSWTPSGDYIATAAEGDGTYSVLFDTNSLVGISDLDARIRSKTLACDKGTSTEVDLI